MELNRILFWKLTEAEHLKARAFCRKLMGNRDDGDDLYHDALLVALGNFGQLRDRTAFRPWLYRIMVNSFKDRLRRPWWKRLTPLTLQIENDLGSHNPGAAYAARRRLEWAFKVLSVEERALVTLFELEGWTIADLAGLFRKTEGNVKVRLSRSRTKMRQALVKRLRQAEAEQEQTGTESEEGICVAVRPSED